VSLETVPTGTDQGTFTDAECLTVCSDRPDLDIPVGTI
jgi:hypothetical protein